MPAVEREVLEEVGVVAKVSDVIGVRHTVGAPTANVDLVFRLDLISGEPRFDGVETIGAGYFDLAEIGDMKRVQRFSKWSIKRALELPAGSDFTRQPDAGLWGRGQDCTHLGCGKGSGEVHPPCA